MNAGIMLLKPNMHAFHSLMQTYFSGNFTYCASGSGVLYGNQDVIANFAFRIPGPDGIRPQAVLGDFNEWPFCFNFRNWPDQQHCIHSADMMLMHTPSSIWPEGLKEMYIERAKHSECRRNPSIQSTVVLRPEKVSQEYNYTL